MVSSEIPHIFILGCERSGSTWLANMVDAHPGVEFFMEPFSKHIEIFSSFPDRNFYIEDCNIGLITLLKNEYCRLSSMKYLFCKREDHRYLKLLDRLIIKIYTYVAIIVKCRVPRKVSRVIELNLNRKEFHILRESPKNKSIDLYVTKELRLNFKLGVISKAFPDAKYIITMRHPGPQISSIIRLMADGHLIELRESLLSLPEYVTAEPRFHKYLGLIDRNSWGGDMENMLIAWWIINYDTLISDCNRYNLRYKIVYHESLSEYLDTISRDSFEFMGLDFSKEVQDYVHESSEYAHIVRSPVDTTRNSQQYYKEQMAKVSSLLLNKISTAIASVDVVDELNKYKLNA